ELALGTHRRGVLPRQLVERALAALARCPHVELDGQPVEVQVDPVLPRGVVEDQGDGFRLRVEDDPDVDERFRNGVARVGAVLRPVGDPQLTGRERHELPRGRYFPPDEVGELVTAVLPALRRRIPVTVLTARLPSTSKEPPRIQLDTARDGERLHVLGTLVYGDPPVARIDAGRLVHLGGAVPQRD
ncbi:MAG: helicase, partial [Gemmatimonadetes bacterium]|nr:helicase [Gemmatimonadota bacterium]NIT66240.1 helicase [Gemmatimonadota bacterium]NIV22804.1 helicase [Gemmatimonadota bacterium]NIY34817.1 helicase [Gemmatimonadota bacterium]